VILPGVHDRVNELVREMAAPLEALQAAESSHPRAREISSLMIVSARHISAAEFAARLERRLTDDQGGTCEAMRADAATLETATMTLVLASAVTALDHCASAIWLWVNPSAKDYADVERVQERAEDANIVLPTPLLDWVHRTKGDAGYRPLKRFRNGQVHGLVRQDVRVFPQTATAVAQALGAGDTLQPPVEQPPPRRAEVTIGADPTKPTTHQRGDLISDVPPFALARWRAFWRLFLEPEKLTA
jgi:hypothetical protein